ncbi:hypothetical protein S1OALGB6SA_558 [Olavius algarvensis spirochete endosymbiont]|nr:hypothetical protein S1OALGB6SA_558 [Olavius algarvensis spirochete endosymbiont]
MLSSSVFVGVCDHLWNRHTAGVKEDSKPLKKFPGSLAADLIQLSQVKC